MSLQSHFNLTEKRRNRLKHFSGLNNFGFVFIHSRIIIWLKYHVDYTTALLQLGFKMSDSILDICKNDLDVLCHLKLSMLSFYSV